MTTYLRKGREAEYQREWRARNAERLAEYSKTRREKDRDEYNAYKRKWAKRHPEKLLEYRQRQRDKRRNNQLKTLYGLSQADFDALLEKQGGKCAACRSPEPRGCNWQVDHDHDTGRVRGILCKSCNIGLGQLGDDPYRVSALLNYLQP